MYEKKEINLNKAVIVLLVALLFFSCSKEEEKKYQPTVEVRYMEGRAKLYRNGKPYYIKGAGGSDHLEKLAAYGGNSIRTWSIQDAEKILDEAHKYGLTVTLGLEVGRPAWGKNFNYWKFWEVDKKIDELIPVILKYKDHPALLMWGVGNEVELYGGNKYIIFYTLNKIARAIKKLDPNHPVMTAFSLYEKPHKFISPSKVMPDIDILGFNAFNRLIDIDDKIYSRTGWNKAYIFSEWGPTGHWENIDTDWGAPRELSMRDKVKMMNKNWQKMNNDSVLFLGSYAFYWGHKYEITHTWFSMFSEEGFESEQVEYLKSVWSNMSPQNFAPVIEEMSIEKKAINDNYYLKANQNYSAKVFAHDPDGDSLSYRWEIRQEELSYSDAGRFRYNWAHLFLESNKSDIQFKAPKQEGDYRLFVFIFDNHNNFTVQNIPFYVIN